MTPVWKARALVAVSLFAFNCSRNLELPDPPGPPTPGTLQGRLVIAQPGTSTRSPAAKAVVQLLASSAGTLADDNGNFLVEGITKEAGTVLLRFDGDGDGQFEKQKSLTLQALKAGPGRNINLGEVLLGENAQLRGKALRADVTTGTGHAGSVVFVPESPFASITADDGSFLLGELPEGEVRIGVYRQGYETVGLDTINLSSGQELTLKTLSLQAAPASMPTPGSLKGKVVLLQEGDVTTVGVNLRALSGQITPINLAADGTFSFNGLAAGLYELTISKDSFRTARINNLLVNANETTDVGDIALATGNDLPTSPTDGGTLSDGGTLIAGSAPVALAPLHSVGAVGKTVRLDGSRSTNPTGGSLVYQWTQVPALGEPTVALSANHSLLASTPTFTAPSTPVQLHFSLVVTNEQGLDSAPVNLVVEIVDPPVALVHPAQVVMLPDAGVVLDGTMSDDTTGSQLTYQWSVTAGPLTLEALPNSNLQAAQVMLRSSPNEGGGEVTLRVSNGLLSSEPFHVPVLVQQNPLGGLLKVAVNPVLFSSPGATVTLSATVSGADPQSGLQLTYQWTQTSGTPLPLIGDQTDSAAFVAPTTEQQLTFTVDVLQGDSHASAQVTVFVVDNQPPVLLASEPIDASASVASPFSVWAAFDEALEPASVTTASAQIRDNQVAVPADVEWQAATKRLTVVPHAPLTVGHTYELLINGVTDASAQKNPFPRKSILFNVRAPLYDSWVSPGTYAVEPRPAVAVTFARTWVLGRKPGGFCADFAMQDPALFYVDSVNTRGSLAEYFTAPNSASCLSFPVTQRRAVAVGNDVYGFLGLGPPSFLYLDTVASVDTYDGTSALGALVTDGSALASALIPSAANPELTWRTAVNNTFINGPSSTVDNTVQYLATNEGASGAMAGARRLVTGIALTNGSLRIFESVNNGPWASLTQAQPTVGVAAMRSAYAGATAVVCMTHDVSGNRTLSCLTRTATDWSSYPDVAQSVPSDGFDVVSRGSTVWVAYSVAGQVRVKMIDLAAAAPGFSIVSGPSGGSSWNNSPSCTATRPEMSARADGLWVTWQELCSANNWEVRLSKMY